MDEERLVNRVRRHRGPIWAVGVAAEDWPELRLRLELAAAAGDDWLALPWWGRAGRQGWRVFTTFPQPRPCSVWRGAQVAAMLALVLPVLRDAASPVLTSEGWAALVSSPLEKSTHDPAQQFAAGPIVQRRDAAHGVRNPRHRGEADL